MARGKPQVDIWVATETFFAEGETSPIRKGETRVRDGHPLLKKYADYFEPADSNVHFDVEQATAAPGEKRGDPATAAAEKGAAGKSQAGEGKSAAKSTVGSKKGTGK